MVEPPFELPKAHRWFAVECNNLAWDLLEQPTRTADDVERMLHAAHAARYHWMQVGTVLNHLRAECLLATVYCAVERAEPAQHHAERLLQFAEQAGTEMTSFDRATAYGAAARAFRLTGNNERAAELYRTARAAAGQLTDIEEQAVFERWYGAAAPV